MQQLTKLQKKQLVRLSDGVVVASECFVARSFFQRFWGLMGQRVLDAHQALLISECNSIHTFFMQFAIDVYYLAENGPESFKVKKIKKKMKPWRFDFPVFGAQAVLETSSGYNLGIREGDVLCLN